MNLDYQAQGVAGAYMYLFREILYNRMSAGTLVLQTQLSVWHLSSTPLLDDLKKTTRASIAVLEVEVVREPVVVEMA